VGAVLVCSCFAVSDRTLRRAIAAGVDDPDSIGEHCDAGTGCGGCLEEIRALIERTSPRRVVSSGV
jgi:bacterioferritin-associated ferredoxin